MGKEAPTKMIAAQCPTDLASAFARLARRRERSLSAELRLAMRTAVAASGLENDESAPPQGAPVTTPPARHGGGHEPAYT